VVIVLKPEIKPCAKDLPVQCSTPSCQSSTCSDISKQCSNLNILCKPRKDQPENCMKPAHSPCRPLAESNAALMPKNRRCSIDNKDIIKPMPKEIVASTGPLLGGYLLKKLSGKIVWKAAVVVFNNQENRASLVTTKACRQISFISLQCGTSRDRWRLHPLAPVIAKRATIRQQGANRHQKSAGSA
jgi:hypothetical protein